MAIYKSTIIESIKKWNEKHPELRKKTLKSIANDIGISCSALSQIDQSSNFQKHASVIFLSKVSDEQMATFKLYKQLQIPLIDKLQKIMQILECDICDLIKLVD
jgi:DNA-binding Xre family transcriptional regulator